MEKIQQLLKENWLYVLGAIVGGIGGYLYYFFIGCSSGSCPITSSPTLSVIWGAAMGGLLLGLFKRKKKNNA